jgi:hypothetical protein
MKRNMEKIAKAINGEKDPGPGKHPANPQQQLKDERLIIGPFHPEIVN